MTAKERKEILTAGCHLATLLRLRVERGMDQRTSCEIALRRWESAYAAYAERCQSKKTRRA
jgi:hypothetical protein